MLYALRHFNIDETLGQLMNNIGSYNIAIQQFNDQLNQTYGSNASKMWLPKMAAKYAVPANTFTGTTKPIHKMDGVPGEVTVVQY